MSYIRISNDSFFDKDYYKTFAKQQKYKFFNVGDNLSTLVPMYQDLLREVLGEKVEEAFQDYALSLEKTLQIQEVFEQKIEETLPNREKTTPYQRKLDWKGKEYELNVSIPSPNNRRIWDYYTIIQICKECIAESKPMYLSIE